jgi:hypothetical protein
MAKMLDDEMVAMRQAEDRNYVLDKLDLIDLEG